MKNVFPIGPMLNMRIQLFILELFPFDQAFCHQSVVILCWSMEK
jgi:hypothetical protein